MNKQLIEKLATAYNQLDVSIFDEILHPNLLYSSQWVIKSIKSKAEYLEYITGKFTTIQTSGANIYAEYAKYHQQPCIVMAQHRKENRVCLLLVRSTQNLITQIDVCQAPHFSQATLSNYYPGLKSELN